LALVQFAPYLLLGLLFAGLLNAFVPRGFITKHLNGNKFWASVKASLLGVPLPLCSCGVIPTGIAFKRQGASNAATVSFLVSTPQTGVDSILITYSMLNLPWAIMRPIVAFISGIVAGVLTPSAKTVETSASQKEEVDHNEKKNLWQAVFKYAFVDFLQDISRPLIVGILIAAGISAFVPETWFTEYLSSPILNMFIILLVSVPLYVCATGSVPIAASLLIKGLSPGAALVFLMAGPATNAATISVLLNSLGKKVTIVYVGTIVVSSMLFGLAIDYLLPTNWFKLGLASLSHHHHFLPESLSIGSAIILVGLIGYVEAKRLLKKKIEVNEMEQVYKIEGMTCNHCKANVDKALSAIEGVESLEIDLESGTAKVQGEVSEDSISKIVSEIGYVFKGKVAG
jgi:uncharacterized membrane protein YraQ (UPF0718 family)/copper chaperone CopZ